MYPNRPFAATPESASVPRISRMGSHLGGRRWALSRATQMIVEDRGISLKFGSRWEAPIDRCGGGNATSSRRPSSDGVDEHLHGSGKASNLALPGLTGRDKISDPPQNISCRVLPTKVTSSLSPESYGDRGLFFGLAIWMVRDDHRGSAKNTSKLTILSSS
jgi:hypothetical protein